MSGSRAIGNTLMAPNSRPARSKASTLVARIWANDQKVAPLRCPRMSPSPANRCCSTRAQVSLIVAAGAANAIRNSRQEH
jgi:hypothetical protein